MLPKIVSLSKTATDRFRHMKGLTGLTPNVLSRIAIMLAIRDSSNLKNASIGDTEGQKIPRDVLFGDYASVYEILINQYIHENRIDRPMPEVITSLIEIGLHKMAHTKNLVEISRLAVH